MAKKTAKGKTKTVNTCRCGEPAIDPHPCPYAEDVNNDSEMHCVCCDECRYQCAMDI